MGAFVYHSRPPSESALLTRLHSRGAGGAHSRGIETNATGGAGVMTTPVRAGREDRTRPVCVESGRVQDYGAASAVRSAGGGANTLCVPASIMSRCAVTAAPAPAHAWGRGQNLGRAERGLGGTWVGRNVCSCLPNEPLCCHCRRSGSGTRSGRNVGWADRGLGGPWVGRAVAGRNVEGRTSLPLLGG